MDWIAIKIGAALIGAGNTILDKKLAMRPNTPPLIHASSFGLVSVPVVLFGGWWVPAVPWRLALSAIVAGMVFMVAVWLYYGVMAKEQVSQVTLLMRLTGVETMVLSALFLGEWLTPIQWGAFVMGSVGGVLLVLAPHQRGVCLNRTTSIIFLITLLLSCQSILLTPIYREHSLWAGIVWQSVGQLIGTLLLVACSRDKAQLWHAARSGGTGLWGILLAEQSVRLITSTLSAQVIAQGVPLALASAMGSLRPMFTLILAAWLLKERWPKETHLLRLSGMGCLLVSMVMAAWGA